MDQQERADKIEPTLALLIQAGMGTPRRAWREKCS